MKLLSYLIISLFIIMQNYFATKPTHYKQSSDLGTTLKKPLNNNSYKNNIYVPQEYIDKEDGIYNTKDGETIIIISEKKKDMNFVCPDNNEDMLLNSKIHFETKKRNIFKQNYDFENPNNNFESEFQFGKEKKNLKSSPALLKKKKNFVETDGEIIHKKYKSKALSFSVFNFLEEQEKEKNFPKEDFEELNYFSKNEKVFEKENSGQETVKSRKKIYYEKTKICDNFVFVQKNLKNSTYIENNFLWVIPKTDEEIFRDISSKKHILNFKKTKEVKKEEFYKKNICKKSLRDVFNIFQKKEKIIKNKNEILPVFSLTQNKVKFKEKILEKKIKNKKEILSVFSLTQCKVDPEKKIKKLDLVKLFSMKIKKKEKKIKRSNLKQEKIKDFEIGDFKNFLFQKKDKKIIYKDKEVFVNSEVFPKKKNHQIFEEISTQTRKEKKLVFLDFEEIGVFYLNSKKNEKVENVKFFDNRFVQTSNSLILEKKFESVKKIEEIPKKAKKKLNYIKDLYSFVLEKKPEKKKYQRIQKNPKTIIFQKKQKFIVQIIPKKEKNFQISITNNFSKKKERLQIDDLDLFLSASITEKNFKSEISENFVEKDKEIFKNTNRKNYEEILEILKKKKKVDNQKFLENKKPRSEIYSKKSKADYNPGIIKEEDFENYESENEFQNKNLDFRNTNKNRISFDLENYKKNEDPINNQDLKMNFLKIDEEEKKKKKSILNKEKNMNIFSNIVGVNKKKTIF